MAGRARYDAGLAPVFTGFIETHINIHIFCIVYYLKCSCSPRTEVEGVVIIPTFVGNFLGVVEDGLRGAVGNGREDEVKCVVCLVLFPLVCSHHSQILVLLKARCRVGVYVCIVRVCVVYSTSTVVVGWLCSNPVF